MKPIPERVEEIVAESYFKFVMTDPDEADAGAEWLKTEITRALTETDQQAREEERKLMLSAQNGYEHEGVKYSGESITDALRIEQKMVSPLLALHEAEKRGRLQAPSNPPSQV